MLVGIIGCIVPGLPGVPVAYAGLWIAQITERVDFTWQTLLLWGIVTVVVTVLDYVACKRVKTPTAAAELIIQQGINALARLDELQDAVVTAVRDTVSQAREHLAYFNTLIPAAARHIIDTNRIRLDNHTQNLPFVATGLIESQRTRLERAVERMGDAVERTMQREQQHLQALADKAALLSPVNTLRRGYSLVMKDGKCVTAAHQLQPGDTVTMQFATGTADATVNESNVETQNLASR